MRNLTKVMNFYRLLVIDTAIKNSQNVLYGLAAVGVNIYEI